MSAAECAAARERRAAQPPSPSLRGYLDRPVQDRIIAAIRRAPAK
jgi:hypothetical protein